MIAARAGNGIAIDTNLPNHPLEIASRCLSPRQTERTGLYQGFEVIDEFIEIETGKGCDALDRRPRLADALARAKRAKCSVVVAKLDRLSRDVAFISTLMARRVPFISVERIIQETEVALFSA